MPAKTQQKEKEILMESVASMSPVLHVPVLLSEAVAFLNPKHNENFVDATFGFGGHARAVLERIGPKGKLVGIERDEEAIALFERTVLPQWPSEIRDRLILRHGTYRYAEEIVEDAGVKTVHGILFDLGMSSWHVDAAGRGFSFREESFMDMRFSRNEHALRAFEIINLYSPDRLAAVFKNLGGERSAQKIARAVVERRKERPFTQSEDLGSFIETILPRHGKIHPATKVFQALRIEVNGELDHLNTGLQSAWRALFGGGRMAVISFHEHEDRIAKRFFKGLVECRQGAYVNKKAVKAGAEEVAKNPRARSARLRVMEKRYGPEN